MSVPYPHLLEPIRIGSVVFKNRMFSAPQGLHALQGAETYPTDAIITNFANKAKGGAALVTCHGISQQPVTPDKYGHLSYNIFDAHSTHYLAQLPETIHFYGAKASMELSFTDIAGYDVSSGFMSMTGRPSLELTEDMLEEIADNYAFQAQTMKELGFDMVLVHMGYRFTLGARFLSPSTNRRTDKYGGSVENRARFPIMIFDRIKSACGKAFPIELRMSGVENIRNGITLEDSIELAKLLEGHIDLLHVHGSDLASSHPMGFQPPMPHVPWAEAIKKSGTSLAVVTIGGIQDLDEAEEIIASGKADIISMGRGWIADPNLGRKAYFGQNKEVVPCVKCMRCHDSACIDGKTYRCTVNPTIGIEDKLERLVKAPEKSKNVAVVGGGPAGMTAALMALKQGHKVTLFEKTGVLGGQLNFSDYVSFKSSLSKFKKYLVRKVTESGIELRLNNAADRASLETLGYDAVIVALGAEPLIPPIPGVNGEGVITAPAVYGHESELSHEIVVIGGGQVGCETGLHLALSGHRVTMLEMQKALAPDASASYRAALIGAIEKCGDLEYILGARCTGIENGVKYTDGFGREHFIPAGNVIIAAGMKGRSEEAAALYNTAPEVDLIGDCSGPGNLGGATRSGFAAAVRL